MNNPINAIDINGDSTFVVTNDDGTYTVTGGNVDNPDDRGIYTMGDEGTYTQVGQSITSHSFFDDNNKPIKRAIIDPNSNEGQNFLDEVISEDPNPIEYALNATNGADYDFKDRGIKDKPDNMTRDQYRYRGSMDKNGNIGSARDFGNMAAGIVAGRNRLSWDGARAGFDLYQSYKSFQKSGEIKFVREGVPTQKAQRVGFKIGQNMRLPIPNFTRYR